MNYVQKSRFFLYPLLGFARNNYPKPQEVYMTWEGEYEVEDCCLILLYPIADDESCKKFQEDVLQHQYFLEHFEVDEGVLRKEYDHHRAFVYVFDMKSMKAEYMKIAKGKYSTLLKPIKTQILNFFKSDRGAYVRVYSYLYPSNHNFYEDYAEILELRYEQVKEGVELCNPPDLEKERLAIAKKVVS